MFGKKEVIREVVRKEHVPYEKLVTIHEHKAPTDESLSLLKEMKEKATAEIHSAFRVFNNEVNGVAIFTSEDVPTGEFKCHAKFMLNGKEHLIKTIFERHEFNRSLDLPEIEERFIKSLHEKFAEIIAKEIINQALESRELHRSVLGRLR